MRESRTEAEEYLKSMQKMATASNALVELQALGKDIQRIMIGEKNVDLPL